MTTGRMATLQLVRSLNTYKVQETSVLSCDVVSLRWYHTWDRVFPSTAKSESIFYICTLQSVVIFYVSLIPKFILPSRILMLHGIIQCCKKKTSLVRRRLKIMCDLPPVWPRLVRPTNLMSRMDGKKTHTHSRLQHIHKCWSPTNVL